MNNEQLIEKMLEYKITPYVHKVINLYAKGYGDKQVASETGRGITTVNMVKTRLRDRMGCNTTAEMFVRLAKEGLV